MHYTYAEYLALEDGSNVRHEFLDGQIYAMAGGTPEHAALQAAVTGMLFAQLEGKPCRVHGSDLHVRVLATGLATYPDVSVICGRTERDPASQRTAVNPTVLVEVLSRSTEDTEDFGRVEKFEHYKQIPSLRQFVLVSHRERVLEVWTRSDEAWTRVASGEGEVARLESIGCTLDVRALYDSAAEPPG